MPDCKNYSKEMGEMRNRLSGGAVTSDVPNSLALEAFLLGTFGLSALGGVVSRLGAVVTFHRGLEVEVDIIKHALTNGLPKLICRSQDLAIRITSGINHI
ncbi:hypothetical protein PMAYCL1PPCAC_20093 [Pristionchus mayeri]|uniref:Uncharacterized protein n=1 Tax=Pristionchus mayeri TaxID=1317129 RepID=A0AAN5CSJ6_9BILA|nr:hypothetical protein PMAYCL1PPCAC_20093 [Pristionchus mayeri]